LNVLNSAWQQLGRVVVTATECEKRIRLFVKICRRHKQQNGRVESGK